MGHAYRSDYQQIVAQRIASIRHGCELLQDALPELNRIRRARLARIAGGVAGITGMALTIIFACMDSGEMPTLTLLASTVGAFATYGIAHLILRFVSPLGVATELPRLTGDLASDVAKLDEHDPVANIRRHLSELETWATAVPMSAMTLLAPLTLHWLFVMMIGSGNGARFLDFATWIRASLVIVGHAHLALIASSIGFAQRMQAKSLEEVKEHSVTVEWAKAWGLTIAVSAMPGVLLLCFPPLITAVTGVLFIPAMFTLARLWIVKERTALAAATQSIVRVAADVAPAPIEAELEELVTPEGARLATVARY